MKIARLAAFLLASATSTSASPFSFLTNGVGGASGREEEEDSGWDEPGGDEPCDPERDEVYTCVDQNGYLDTMDDCLGDCMEQLVESAGVTMDDYDCADECAFGSTCLQKCTPLCETHFYALGNCEAAQHPDGCVCTAPKGGVSSIPQEDAPRIRAAADGTAAGRLPQGAGKTKVQYQGVGVRAEDAKSGKGKSGKGKSGKGSRGGGGGRRCKNVSCRRCKRKNGRRTCVSRKKRCCARGNRCNPSVFCEGLDSADFGFTDSEDYDDATDSADFEYADFEDYVDTTDPADFDSALNLAHDLKTKKILRD